MKADHAVLWIRYEDDPASCNTLRLVHVSVIAKVAGIDGVFVIHSMVDAQGNGSLIENRVCLKLRNIEKVVAGTCGNDPCARIPESGQKCERARRLAVGFNARNSVRGGCANP